MVLAILLGVHFGRGSLFSGNGDSDSLPRVEVELSQATYSGNVLPNGVNQFLGIRYAKAPTGDRRWRAPEEPEAEDDVQSATSVRPVELFFPSRATQFTFR